MLFPPITWILMLFPIKVRKPKGVVRRWTHHSMGKKTEVLTRSRATIIALVALSSANKWKVLFDWKNQRKTTVSQISILRRRKMLRRDSSWGRWNCCRIRVLTRGWLRWSLINKRYSIYSRSFWLRRLGKSKLYGIDKSFCLGRNFKSRKISSVLMH